jgi:hypothetical protein
VRPLGLSGPKPGFKNPMNGVLFPKKLRTASLRCAQIRISSVLQKSHSGQSVPTKAPGRYGMGLSTTKAGPPFHSHLRLVAQQNRDLVSHLFTRCTERRGWRSEMELVDQIIFYIDTTETEPSLHLDMYEVSSCDIVTLTQGT